MGVTRSRLAGLAVCLAVVLSGGGAAGQPAPGTRFQDCPDCPQMIVVPKGEFLMGATQADTERDLAKVTYGDGPGTVEALLGQTPHQRAARWMAYEHPQHPVTVPHDFAMGIYPVTVAEYAAFVKATGHQTGTCYFIADGRTRAPRRDAWLSPLIQQGELHPVVCVTWADAVAYVRWLNRRLNPTGNGDGPYRLPSEAEWEYAARAGTRTAYWWGDDVGVNNTLCNGCNDAMVFGNAVPDRDDPTAHLRGTMRVGPFRSNPFGLYNMPGNVAQWTQDCWNASYAGAPADGSPWLTGDCGKRVQRGGSWVGYPWTLRATSRTGGPVDDTWNFLGFRVAKSLE